MWLELLFDTDEQINQFHTPELFLTWMTHGVLKPKLENQAVSKSIVYKFPFCKNFSNILNDLY